jgi:hypothetical protein
MSKLNNPLNATRTPQPLRIQQVESKAPLIEDDADFDSMLLSHMDEFEQQQSTQKSQRPRTPPNVHPSNDQSGLTPSTPNTKSSFPLSPIPLNFDNWSQSPAKTAQDSPFKPNNNLLSPQRSTLQLTVTPTGTLSFSPNSPIFN